MYSYVRILLLFTLQNSFSSYVRSTREEKFFVSMQQRLEQAAHNDSERRELLVQLKLKHTEELILVSVIKFCVYKYLQHILLTERSI